MGPISPQLEAGNRCAAGSVPSFPQKVTTRAVGRRGNFVQFREACTSVSVCACPPGNNGGNGWSLESATEDLSETHKDQAEKNNVTCTSSPRRFMETSRRRD